LVFGYGKGWIGLEFGKTKLKWAFLGVGDCRIIAFPFDFFSASIILS